MRSTWRLARPGTPACSTRSSTAPTEITAPTACIDKALSSRLARRLSDWQGKALKISTSNEEFYRFYHQAVEDMAALRLPIRGTDHLEFVPAAGVPWFVGLFGRDSLIVSLQNALVYPDFARGALEVLGHWQATDRDDYRDAEPGKIMHELRTGELAHFRLIPHTPYYGTADATPLYLIVLHSAWRTTGDKGLIEQHLATAERMPGLDRRIWQIATATASKSTRPARRTASENQGWKDAGDAVVYPDGTLVQGPKAALASLQGGRLRRLDAAWPRSLTFIGESRPRRSNCAGRRRNCSSASTEAFWDEESVSTPSASTAIRSRC